MSNSENPAQSAPENVAGNVEVSKTKSKKRSPRKAERLTISAPIGGKLTTHRSSEFARQERAWKVIDASGVTLGRLASQVAQILLGKDKACFSKHVDVGDFVVVINAEKIRLSGNKLNDKVYYKHTGYIGHLKSRTAGEMMQKNPAFVVESAVFGMLPKGVLGRGMRKKLKVYAGAEHPHAAQLPAVVSAASSVAARA
jgi:large subunit ribosomal protein L13